MHTPGITGVPVNNVEETFQYLKQIVMNEESYRKIDEHHSSSVETTEHDHPYQCRIRNINIFFLCILFKQSFHT